MGLEKRGSNRRGAWSWFVADIQALDVECQLCSEYS
jgi:hypothetical protein